MDDLRSMDFSTLTDEEIAEIRNGFDADEMGDVDVEGVDEQC